MLDCKACLPTWLPTHVLFKPSSLEYCIFYRIIKVSVSKPWVLHISFSLQDYQAFLNMLLQLFFWPKVKKKETAPCGNGLSQQWTASYEMFFLLVTQSSSRNLSSATRKDSRMVTRTEARLQEAVREKSKIHFCEPAVINPGFLKLWP